ncbi:MAG: cupin domain-containing protein [Verrucomicrobiota bacterium]
MKKDTSSKAKGLPAAQVARVADHVQYQAGSIVSREIVKQPTGTVTVFAFDEGQGLSEHTAPFDALVQVLDGEVEILIAGQPHHLHTGEMILMPAQQPHAVKALKRFKMMLIMIRS